MSTVTLTPRSIADSPIQDEVREQARNNGAATALGWFSIALGAAEVVAPHGLSRIIGIESSPKRQLTQRTSRWPPLLSQWGRAYNSQGIQLLAKSEEIAGNRTLKMVYRQLLDETHKHARLVELRLESAGTATSKLKDGALALGGFNWGLFFQAQSDTPAKLAAFVYAVLHLEIGGYELLRRTAQRVGDNQTKLLCEGILEEKRAMAERLAHVFDTAVEATLVALRQ